MKRLVLVFVALLFVSTAAALVFAGKDSKGMFSAKVGDAIYICGCGESCKCGTLSHSEGTCGCGHKLVKTTVAKMEKDRVYYKVDGKEFSAPQQGKYACGCGEGCNCGAVSQNEGNCGCGKPMVKVK